MTRVILFKNEGEIDGEPYGPARATEVDENGMPVSGKRPYLSRCHCDAREGEPDGICANCGKRIPIEWVTRTTAQEMADTLGLELEEV